MKALKLYYITERYINYLRQFDDKVLYNKKSGRPYIGVVFTYNNFYYFAPLSSPKPKHLNMKKDAADIFKIEDGKLGIVNINNMIPTPKECLVDCLTIISDIKYKNLLQEQLTYLNDNKKSLLGKVRQFRKRYQKGYLNKRILERCCDFNLLEDKCLEYKVDVKQEV